MKPAQQMREWRADERAAMQHCQSSAPVLSARRRLDYRHIGCRSIDLLHPANFALD
jgi:hypothetical protein